MTLDLKVDQKALRKLALTLENDIAAQGWDQPHNLYAIAGTHDDPYLIRLAMFSLEVHPVDVLNEIYHQGLRVLPDWLGLVLVNEGWRHLNVDELEEVAPEIVAEVRKAATAFFPEVTEEEREKTLQKTLMKVVSRVAPSNAPEHLRKEVRCVVICLRGGHNIQAVHTRDGDTLVLGLDDENGVPDGEVGGRIPDALQRFINGEVPEDSEEESDAVPPTGSVD